MTLTISLIIPTYKREGSLGRVLKSLKSEERDLLEIIVVSQGADTLKKLGGKVTILRLAKPSMTRARNFGAKKARGDLLLFLDDDVVVRKGLVGNHVRNFTDLTVAATCGRVITPDQKREPVDRHVGRIGVFGNVSGGFSSTIRQEVDTVIGCNMCWRRDVYTTLGGVDEQFTGNALREETDLSLRAKKLGYNIIFEPKAVVEHHRAPTGGARKSQGRLQWYYDFFSNETYFFLKHRPHILLPFFWLTKSEWAMRCMFGFGREVSVRSFCMPFAGMADGVRKYRTFLHKL